MRIAVVSDTHGNINNFLKTIENMGQFDLMIHLGDYAKDGERLKSILSIPTIIVKGNGDFGSPYNEDELLELAGKKILLTHGHRYNIRWDYTNLYYKGLEVGANLVLYGHTHVPINIKENELIIMNPGSATLPRTSDGIKTFGLINIRDEIETKIVRIK